MGSIGQPWAGLLGGLILAWQVAPALSATDLPAAIDLRSEARQAGRHGEPLVILYSRQNCSYCETVKRDFLQPLTNNPRYRNRLLVRQIDQDSDRTLNDFQGEKTSHSRFASREKVRLVPFVAFYGPDGRLLAEPIIGARLPDFYADYLESAIEQSRQALKKP